MRNWRLGEDGCRLLFDSAEHVSHSLWLPTTGDRFLLSERHVEVQGGHNDSDHCKEKSPGIFGIVIGCEGPFLYGCRGSHHFVFFLTDVRGGLAKKLRKEEVTIPPDKVFIVHGFPKGSGGEVLPTESYVPDSGRSAAERRHCLVHTATTGVSLQRLTQR